MKFLDWLTTHFTAGQIVGGLFSALVFCAVLPILIKVIVIFSELWRAFL